MHTKLFVLAILSWRVVGLGLNNGVAFTPMMGWNPYNVFACETTEVEYRAAADAMKKLGLIQLGYDYLNMDCGWGAERSQDTGGILWNNTKIPSGVDALAAYARSLGLKFGIFSDAGYYACDRAGGWEHWPGSLGYENDDAYYFILWGATYLKYDNCFIVNDTDPVDFEPTIDEEYLFLNMYMALSLTGAIYSTNVVYAINEWGIQDPARWKSNVANSWRIANDLGASFADMQRVINQLVPITIYAEPGGWNDLDLLQVGNAGLTVAEWKTNFAFWAAAKSPLLISTDLTHISQEALDILSNKWLIGINQDSLGRSIDFKRRYTDDYDVWAGPLQDGSTVALLLNWQDNSRSVTFALPDIGLASAVLTDLWDGTTIGPVNGSYTTMMDAHGVLIYRLSSTTAALSYTFHTYSADAFQNVLTGGASTRQFSPGNNVVGNIGMGGTLAFVGIDGGDDGGTKLIRVVYINGDHTFTNSACSNCRRVQVSVNDGTPVVAEMPISAMSWDILSAPYLLSLDGFLAGSNNKITFSNPTAWAPDIFTIEVQV